MCEWKKLVLKGIYLKGVFVVDSSKVTKLCTNSIEWCPRISFTMGIAPLLKRSPTAQTKYSRRTTTRSKIDRVSFVAICSLANSAERIIVVSRNR